MMYLGACPKCRGSVERAWDIWGERLYCINCGWDYHPMVDPELLVETKATGGHTPTHGKNTYSYKEKKSMGKNIMDRSYTL